MERYHLRPQTPVDRFFLPEESEFLASIGATESEMHAYIKDYATLGDPSPTSALLIAAARRNFFLTQQRGISGGAQPMTERDLPSEAEDYQEIPYLPRIIRKAQAKLQGTLPASVMFYSEKDRQFLRGHGGIHPADFLYQTWWARGDTQKLVSAVLNAMNAAAKEAEKAGDPAPENKSSGNEGGASSGSVSQQELNLQ